MERNEKIKVAVKAVEKKMTYEQLYYSDYMYGFENQTDYVWDFVGEIEQYGLIAFKAKYKKELEAK